jgi:hypothetical protein
MRTLSLALTATWISASAAQAVEILKHEPPRKSLHFAQTVFVDDGTCPQGQVKEVMGGTGGNTRGTIGERHRHRRCVQRP